MMNTFLEPLKLDEDALDECPYCGGNNLHQEDYSIFNPDNNAHTWDVKTGAYKSEPRTRVTHIMGSTITTACVDPEATNDPSSQGRGALLVEFSCETCENKPTLAMFQHKGTTFIGWKK